MLNAVLLFLETYTEELGAAAVIGGGGLWCLRWFKKPDKADLSDETIEKIAPTKPKDGPALTVPEFIRLRRELKADLEQELAAASDEEKTQLRARIAELESQIANPDAALAEAQKRITDLEALLDRAGNDIGGDRINEAKAALEKGDYSIADGIFAEIEARNDLAVQESARAAYGRGEVAEAEIRWVDAATHYVTAAKRHETFQHLRKASEFLGRAGRYQDALFHSTQLVRFATGNATQEDLATALNANGIHLKALGDFEKSEAQYQKALAIARSTIGENHPSYAIYLNNLANVVEAQGRFAEAEGLYRNALTIDRATIGEENLDYAIHLNNLAVVVQAQGRFTEAEDIFRDAQAVTRATIGENHPNYAIDLNNLAHVVQAQGRFAEAEGLFRDAQAITRTTIGEDHPDFAIDLNNLAAVVQAQGRFAEAEGHYRDALAIDRATIGVDHPSYAIHLNNLAVVLAKQDKPEEARPLFEQALAIFQDRLPADHPNIASVERQLSALPTPP